jgi:hypothetical protein
MEFVRGRTLQQMLEEGKRFSSDEVMRIRVELCGAVAAVHGLSRSCLSAPYSC